MGASKFLSAFAFSVLSASQATADDLPDNVQVLNSTPGARVMSCQTLDGSLRVDLAEGGVIPQNTNLRIRGHQDKSFFNFYQIMDWEKVTSAFNTLCQSGDQKDIPLPSSLSPDVSVRYDRPGEMFDNMSQFGCFLPKEFKDAFYRKVEKGNKTGEEFLYGRLAPHTHPSANGREVEEILSEDFHTNQRYKYDPFEGVPPADAARNYCVDGIVPFRTARVFDVD